MKVPLFIIGEILVAGGILWGASTIGPQNHTERDWSTHLAHQLGGETEYRLPDGSRVDILTEEIAWECEWSDKWEEAIGQSVFYGLSTNRKPGVYLLLRNNHDEDYLRCLMVCRYLRIELQVIDTD